MESLVHRLSDNVERLKLSIEVIRAHDFLGADVPTSCTDDLYRHVTSTSVDVLQTVVDEYGENEIGLSIARAKKVMLTYDNDLLNELKIKYARDVIVRSQADEVFVDPEHIHVRATEFIVPKTWQRLKTIEPILGSTPNIFLPDTFPLLESVMACELTTNAVQPSIREIFANRSTMKASQIPNVVHLCCSEIEIDIPLSHVIETHHWRKDKTPNAKIVIQCDRIVQLPETVIVANGRFVRPSQHDHCKTVSWPCKLKSDKKRYLCCNLIIEATDEPLEFYHCYFYDEYHDQLSKEEVLKLIPNATII